MEIHCRANRHPLRSWRALFKTCDACLASLIPAPPVCEVCYGFHLRPGLCPENYLRVTGVFGDERFESLEAFYLLTDGVKPFFRQWKKTPSAFGLNPLISDHHPALHRLRARNARLILPIPQRQTRILQLGRSTSLEVAQKVGEKCGIPVVENLFQAREFGEQQGKNQGSNRYTREEPFFVNPLRKNEVEKLALTPEVLVVDDLMTSGQTLRHFVKLLRKSGVSKVHVCVLALRPRRS